ncbi:MAG: hypothetical protein P4M15_07740 [Alphaproteobacteria bacterium]|nr:hypothetical protein [Alphaproteobacteria bacterium]
MASQQDLLLAILSMDAYNRGYDSPTRCAVSPAGRRYPAYFFPSAYGRNPPILALADDIGGLPLSADSCR